MSNFVFGTHQQHIHSKKGCRYFFQNHEHIDYLPGILKGNGKNWTVDCCYRLMIFLCAQPAMLLYFLIFQEGITLNFWNVYKCWPMLSLCLVHAWHILCSCWTLLSSPRHIMNFDEVLMSICCSFVGMILVLQGFLKAPLEIWA